MAHGFWISIEEQGEVQCEQEHHGPLMLGRQGHRGGFQYAIENRDGTPKLVIASPDRTYISREQAKIEPLAGGRVRVSNISDRFPISFEDGSELGPRTGLERDAEFRDFDLPSEFAIGRVRVRLSSAPSANTPPPMSDDIFSLRETEASVISSGRHYHASERSEFQNSRAASGAEEQVRWLESALMVLKSSAADSQFYQSAADAIINVGGFDVGHILERVGGEWKSVAKSLSISSSGASLQQPLSTSVLQKMLAEKDTIWKQPRSGDLSNSNSLTEVTSVVASPVLDRQDRVVAALYGVRTRPLESTTPAGSRIDALKMRVLASSVASGQARLDQERKAGKLLGQFEQFFTPQLAQKLTSRPEMLQSEKRVITTLFCDIREFSKIAGSIGPEQTLSWVQDVMGELSECVFEEDGVLVDYIGDELMAMWGAPDDQPDHAERACRAAVAMVNKLPTLNERWSQKLDTAINVGVGVNTGEACVGNTGSHKKFKYGPLGDPVNLASRVQGANKHFKTQILVTESTRAMLGTEWQPRKIGQIRAVNINKPVELYQLTHQPTETWGEVCAEYEKALEHFLKKEFSAAAHSLGTLLLNHRGDGPSLVLMARTVTCLVDEGKSFDPVLSLSSK